MLREGPHPVWRDRRQRRGRLEAVFIVTYNVQPMSHARPQHRRCRHNRRRVADEGGPRPARGEEHRGPREDHHGAADAANAGERRNNEPYALEDVAAAGENKPAAAAVEELFRVTNGEAAVPGRQHEAPRGDANDYFYRYVNRLPQVSIDLDIALDDGVVETPNNEAYCREGERGDDEAANVSVAILAQIARKGLQAVNYRVNHSTVWIEN